MTLHAWNAVKVVDNWQLVDTTWDDINSSQNPSLYKSDYLIPPPEVMITDHLPEQSDWQLLHRPINQDYFEKQLILAPQSFAENLQVQWEVKISSNDSKKTKPFKTFFNQHAKK